MNEYRKITVDTNLPVAFRDLNEKRARYKGYWSGRGAAKTHSFATALVLRATQTKNFRVLCCREIQRSIKESVKKVLDDKIEHLHLTHMFHSTKDRITSRNGGEFFFEGLRDNVESIRSYEGINILWLEEAHRVSAKSLEVVIPTIRMPGSEIWASFNPDKASDPIDKLFREKDAEGNILEILNMPPKELWEGQYDEWMIGHRLELEDNPFFKDSPLILEMERDKRRDPDRYAHVWLGEYARQSEATVFRNWHIGTMEVPEGMVPRYGADWGFAVDPTALVRVYVFPKERKLYIDAEVVKVGCAIDDTPRLFDSLTEKAGPFKEDGSLLYPQHHPRKLTITADSNRPETIHHMRRHGFPQMKGARKGAGSLEEGVEFLKNYDITVHPNCPVCIDELTLYAYEVDDHTGEVLPKFADQHNHVIDAIRYSVEDLRRSAPIGRPIVISQPRTYLGDMPAGDGYPSITG